MDSFLGGAAGFGPNVPSYGDVGSGYTGDYFGGSSSGGGGIGSSILEGLGRGALGALSGSPGSSSPGSPQGGPYASQARNDIQNLLAMAIRSFGEPKSVI